MIKWSDRLGGDANCGDCRNSSVIEPVPAESWKKNQDHARIISHRKLKATHVRPVDRLTPARKAETTCLYQLLSVYCPDSKAQFTKNGIKSVMGQASKLNIISNEQDKQ